MTKCNLKTNFRTFCLEFRTFIELKEQFSAIEGHLLNLTDIYMYTKLFNSVMLNVDEACVYFAIGHGLLQ